MKQIIQDERRKLLQQKEIEKVELEDKLEREQEQVFVLEKQIQDFKEELNEKENEKKKEKVEIESILKELFFKLSAKQQ